MHLTVTMGSSLSATHFLQQSFKQQHQSNSCTYKQLIAKVQALGLTSSYMTVKQLVCYPDDLFIRLFKLLVQTRSYKLRKLKTILVDLE